MPETPAAATRTERDSMGEVEVPADALYGASTQRAVLNFPISGQPIPARFIRALALVKKAAAETNRELGLLDPDVAARSPPPPQEVIDGKLDDQFPIDIYQTGSGTSTNTNANEVIAHRAIEILGAERGRKASTRTTTSICCQSLERRDPDGDPAVGGHGDRRGADPRPRAAPRRRWTPRARSSGRSSRPAARICRTRRRSGSARSSRATPARSRNRSVGREAAQRRAARGAARRHRGRHRASTRIPSSRAGRARACRALTGLAVHETRNHFPRPGDARRGVAAHGALRTIAISLWKIGSDIRLMGIGSDRRPRRAAPARDPAGLEHHARQGQPGDHRVADDGGRASLRQRRRRSRCAADRQPLRAERDDAGRRRQPRWSRSRCWRPRRATCRARLRRRAAGDRPRAASWSSAARCSPRR